MAGSALKRQGPIIVIAYCAIIAAISLGFYIYQTGGWPFGAPPQHEEEQEGPATPEDASTASPVVVGPDDESESEGIDQVRVSPDGSAVVAGLAPPGSTVKLMRDGRVVGTATAEGQGQWAIILDERLNPGSHLLSVEITSPDGQTRVGELAVVAQVGGDGERPLVALVPYAVDDAPVEVLQTPDGDAEPGEDSEIATPMVNIRTIQAVRQGAGLQVGGDGRGGETVTIDVNGTESPPVALSGGAYLAEIDIDPEARRFDLKVTLLDRDGEAVASARIRLARTQIEQTLDERTLVVVQKGDALWRIAYRTYGQGIRYVDIYRRNAHQISDPDLIYPDQVLILPKR